MPQKKKGKQQKKGKQKGKQQKGRQQQQRRQGGKKGQGKRTKNSNKQQAEEQKQDDTTYTIQGINLITEEEYKKTGQTFPPTKRISEQFEDEAWPMNETMPHPGKEGKLRMESDERKAIENNLQWQARIASIREAAEVHRQVRQSAQLYVKPGMKMIDICQFIERNSSYLVGYDASKPMHRGWGFPTGCSLNHCAAHYTPNPGDNLTLKVKDLCKIDFGVQINGYIIDCAFSMSFDPMHDELMKAVKAATNEGVRVMGIDARLGEVGARIQEVMESHQCTYDNKTYDVKAIANLNGHSIAPWVIHGGKTVPIIKTDDQTKMEEGELFAIETFGSTGKGRVLSDGECSHYAKIPNAPKVNIDHKATYELLRHIKKRFGTIPFCRRWLHDEGQTRHLMSLKRLVDMEIVRDYPPLCDQLGSFTAQYEHTILLKPTCKEIVSRGTDF